MAGHLQVNTKRGRSTGREARATTAVEFEDVVKLVVDHTKQEFKRVTKKRRLVPKYSWDNNATNKAARLEMGLEKADVVPLPTYSPDFHQIIEHAIGEFKERLLAEVMEHSGQPMTPATAQELAVEVFKGLDWEGIAATEPQLICCWQQVGTPEGEPVMCLDGVQRMGTGGDWAVASLR